MQGKQVNQISEILSGVSMLTKTNDFSSGMIGSGNTKGLGFNKPRHDGRGMMGNKGNSYSD